MDDTNFPTRIGLDYEGARDWFAMLVPSEREAIAKFIGSTVTNGEYLDDEALLERFCVLCGEAGGMPLEDMLAIAEYREPDFYTDECDSLLEDIDRRRRELGIPSPSSQLRH